MTIFSCACFLSLDDDYDNNIIFIEEHVPSTTLIIPHVLSQLIFKTKPEKLVLMLPVTTRTNK